MIKKFFDIVESTSKSLLNFAIGNVKLQVKWNNSQRTKDAEMYILIQNRQQHPPSKDLMSLMCDMFLTILYEMKNNDYKKVKDFLYKCYLTALDSDYEKEYFGEFLYNVMSNVDREEIKKYGKETYSKMLKDYLSDEQDEDGDEDILYPSDFQKMIKEIQDKYNINFKCYKHF